ncbi:helix-turn-helix domain-containing protein [Bacillus sp. SCS-153A]|uniref:helix-turn-helix domain-containing protein n=1 Tax=Rossellomorea sedimentorum TaxID=3115294 RepID=UPI0039058D65
MENFTELIGKNLKSIRQLQKMTQQEVSDQICTQAMLSKIENGQCSPTIEMVYLLCRRLNIEVSTLVRQSLSERSDYIDEVLFQLKKAAMERNYEEIKQIITVESKTALAKLPSYQKILIWYEAIYLFYINKDYENCFEKIDAALSVDNFVNKLSIIDIEILITKANFYTDLERYNEAINLYKEIETHIKSIPENINLNIIIKIYYNFSRVYRLKQNLQDSVDYCLKGINKCLNSQSMYLLGDLYFQLGKNQHDLNKFEASIDSFEYALTIYKIKENQRMIDITKKNLERLKPD